MFSLRRPARLAAGVGIAVAPLAGVLAVTQSVGAAAPAGVVVAAATEPDSTPTDDSAAADADCAAADAATGDSTAAEGSAAPTEAAATEAADGVASGEAGAFDGEWVIAEGAVVRYRVPEQLAGVDTEAVGEGTGITGSFTFSGNEATAGCIVVDMTTITSDESMRDGQFNDRIMETATYPTATFALTEPVVFDALPEVDGDPVTVSITGALTLHGVTNEVTFDATVQAGEDRVGVLGEIPVAFADYDIEDPSAGPAEVGDDGTLEILLAFEQA